MTRAQLLERYQALPFPTTSDEHWRFTDLKGFDPDSFSANGAKTVERAGSMLDVETAALAHVSEAGIEIERAPEGVVFEPLTEKHELLGTLVGTDEKFAAHNAAEGKHGLLVRVPAGLELQQPLYVRVTSSVPEAALFWRVLVVAEEGSRFSFIEEHASAARDLPGYSNVVAELFVGDGAKLEYVSIQNLSQETWHFASHRATVGRDADGGAVRCEVPGLLREVLDGHVFELGAVADEELRDHVRIPREIPRGGSVLLDEAEATAFFGDDQHPPEERCFRYRARHAHVQRLLELEARRDAYEQAVLPLGGIVGRKFLVCSDQRSEQLVLFGERLEDDALRRALDLDARLGDVRERRGLDIEHGAGPLHGLGAVGAEAVRVDALEISEAPVLVRGRRKR